VKVAAADFGAHVVALGRACTDGDRRRWARKHTQIPGEGV
jgi:hypothetical protein